MSQIIALCVLVLKNHKLLIRNLVRTFLDVEGKFQIWGEGRGVGHELTRGVQSKYIQLGDWGYGSGV